MVERGREGVFGGGGGIGGGEGSEGVSVCGRRGEESEGGGV